MKCACGCDRPIPNLSRPDRIYATHTCYAKSIAKRRWELEKAERENNDHA